MGMEKTRDLEAKVQKLLYGLCVDLDFFLPPSKQQRLRESPPLDADAFTNAVLVAERIDPESHPELRREMHARVERHVHAWTHESEYQ